MNRVKLKAALAHIGEGFYKLADAIEDVPTETPDKMELPLDETEEKKPAAKKKAKKKTSEKVSSLHSSDDLVALLNEKAKDGKRKEAMEVLDGRKVAELTNAAIQEVYAAVAKL